jgi:Calcineurin-like phosphoesterase
MANHDNKRILVISDLHCPYQHPDAVRFLRALKAKYKPTRVILSGDEVEYAGISFHDHDPDMDAPGRELKRAIEELTPIYKMFPVAEVLESNHGSLVLRKALANGLSREYIRAPGEILKAPPGWTWHFDIVTTLPTGFQCYFHHSKGPNAKKNSQAMGMSFVMGHHHEQMDISYWGNPNALLFGMTVGCLVDPESLAMLYNKNNLKRPVIGCAVIIEGLPILIPMVLNRNGRWIGKL